MNIYCTYLTIYHGNKLPPFYIGSTSLTKITNGYHGSVSSKKYKETWLRELRENPNLFKTRIISTHYTRNEATTKELYMLGHLHVSFSPLYINMCDGRNFNYGGTHSLTTRLKQSTAKRTRDKLNPPQKMSDEKKGTLSKLHLNRVEKTCISRRKTFILTATEIHSGKYSYEKVEYCNVDTPVTICCPMHGEFLQRPSSHLRGSRCPKCWHKIKQNLYNKPQSQFIQEAIQIHGNLYSYNKVAYQNTKTPVTITCSVHGDFNQRPEKHLIGLGCRKCGHERLKGGN